VLLVVETAQAGGEGFGRDAAPPSQGSVRLPSTLTLIGKAFGQMQLAAAELDRSLDPFVLSSPGSPVRHRTHLVSRSGDA
jgi:hypothetical protein